MTQIPELPEPVRLEVVRVQPCDVLVLTCPHRLTEDDVARIRERFNRGGLAGLETLVLDGGMQLAVMRKEVDA